MGALPHPGRVARCWCPSCWAVRWSRRSRPPPAAHRGLLHRDALFPGADGPLQAGQGGLPVLRPGTLHALRGDQRGAHPAAHAAQPGLRCACRLSASQGSSRWGGGEDGACPEAEPGLGARAWGPGASSTRGPVRAACQHPASVRRHCRQPEPPDCRGAARPEPSVLPQIMVGEGIVYCLQSRLKGRAGAEGSINAGGCNFNSFLRRTVRFVGTLCCSPGRSPACRRGGHPGCDSRNARPHPDPRHCTGPVPVLVGAPGLGGPWVPFVGQG